MKYFIEPFRESILSQLHNGGNYRSYRRNKQNKEIKQNKETKKNKLKIPKFCFEQYEKQYEEQFTSLKEVEEITNIHKLIICFVFGILFFLFSFLTLFLILRSTKSQSLKSQSSKLKSLKKSDYGILVLNTLFFTLFVRILIQ